MLFYMSVSLGVWVYEYTRSISSYFRIKVMVKELFTVVNFYIDDAKKIYS